MPLPAVPDTVRDLDADVVIEVLSRHAVNVSEAARELEVNSADLRRLLWARPQLAAAAAEMEERRLDIAERNILEALTSDDPRMRMASAMFTVRYSAKARKRGWITNSSASVDANAAADAEPKHYRVVWSKPDEPERELAAGEFVRDGRILSMPSYGGDRAMMLMMIGNADDIVEGHLAQRSPMIEHETAEPIEASEPAVGESIEPEPPAPESAAARYERERIDAWIRARARSPIRSPPVCYCRKPIMRGRIGRRCRTARRERVFIGPVTPNGGLSGKRRRDRRWGSRAEPFRSERSRRMRGANVARVARCRRCQRGPVPPAAAGSCVGTPSTMIAAGNLVDREAGPEPSNKD